MCFAKNHLEFPVFRVEGVTLPFGVKFSMFLGIRSFLFLTSLKIYESYLMGFLLKKKKWLFVAQTVKNLPAMQETQVRSLGQEDLLEKGKATHSSMSAWRIPWTEEPGGLQSIRSQRVEHDRLSTAQHEKTLPISCRKSMVESRFKCRQPDLRA